MCICGFRSFYCFLIMKNSQKIRGIWVKIKEKIYQALNTMGSDELLLIYEQIQLIRHIKQSSQPPKSKVTIEDIPEMTSTSKGSWADAVNEERMERI